MTALRAALFVTVCLWSAAAAAQTAPALTRDQRALLHALIDAVDGAAAQAPPPDEGQWLTHVLRASDGSHYVAFAVTPPALPDRPLVIYVRLATASRAGAVTTAERSVVREWLSGARVDPRLLPRRGGVAIGDMPAMGAGSLGRRSDVAVASPELQAIGLERQRARERRDEEERRRRATLEGAATPGSDLLPFEDFEIGPAGAFADGTRTIQRALTAGPGAYDLYVAWADATVPAARARPQVARRSLQLGTALPDFGLSSIVIADRIGVKAAPHTPLEQRAHPYTIGLTEITPARHATYTTGDRLAVAFQIINASPAPDGKPNVVVNLRIARPTRASDDTVASLSPMIYDAATLPPDFDARAGHPLIAAMSAPLATVPRGQYRLVVTAEDRISSNVASASTPFTIVGTPQSLLEEAPALGPRFDHHAMLQQAVLGPVLDRLAPPGASAVLTAAIAAARAGRFSDLLVAAPPAPPGEQGARAALTGLALLSLGNPASAIEFQRALTLQAPAAPTQVLLGAARALQGRDADAIAAWEAARSDGFPAPILDRFMTEALLRRKEFARAAATMPVPPVTAIDEVRTFAAAQIGGGRHADAIAALEPALRLSPGDQQARWLLLHALYAQFVGGNTGGRDRIRAEAQRYLDAQGAHATLAAEWLKVVTAS